MVDQQEPTIQDSSFAEPNKPLSNAEQLQTETSTEISADILNLQETVDACRIFFRSVLEDFDASQAAAFWTDEIRDELLPSLDSYMDHLTFVSAEDLNRGLDLMADKILTQFWKDKAAGQSPHYLFSVPDITSNLFITAKILKRLSDQGINENQLTAGFPFPSRDAIDQRKAGNSLLRAFYCDDFLISGNQLTNNLTNMGFGRHIIKEVGLPQVLVVASSVQSLRIVGLDVQVESMLAVPPPSPQLGPIITGEHSCSDYGVKDFFDKVNNRVKDIARKISKTDQHLLHRLISNADLSRGLFAFDEKTNSFLGIRLPHIVHKAKPYKLNSSDHFNDPELGALYEGVLGYFDEDSQQKLQRLIESHR